MAPRFILRSNWQEVECQVKGGPGTDIVDKKMTIRSHLELGALNNMPLRNALHHFVHRILAQLDFQDDDRQLGCFRLLLSGPFYLGCNARIADEGNERGEVYEQL